MWYLINVEGEKCMTVESREEAESVVTNNDWYIGYVYSNNGFIC